MRAFLVPRAGDGPDAARTADVAPPEPKPGQALVRVHASAFNNADLKTASWKGAAGFIHKKVAPLVFGYDLSGVVTRAAGTLAEGDEVFGFLPYAGSTANGTMAEEVAVDPGWLGRKPPGISHADAAALATVGCTALQVLVDIAKLQKGQRVLLTGASGGVGAITVQVAKLLGAHVVGTASARNVAYVQSLGADEVLDRRATQLGDAPGPFDVVFDAAAASSFSTCAKLLAPGGQYVVTLPSPSFVVGKLASLFSSKGCHTFIAKSRPKDLEQLAAWLAAGELRSLLTETVPLDDAASVFQRMARGETHGKIAVTTA